MQNDNSYTLLQRKKYGTGKRKKHWLLKLPVVQAIIMSLRINTGGIVFVGRLYNEARSRNTGYG